jgi:hypothetical protein
MASPPMNSKLAFVIGPIAAPILVVMVVMATSILSGLQDGIAGMLEAATIFFLFAVAYSYTFSIVFGLPIYILFMRRGWTSFLGCILGAVLATVLAVLILVVLSGQEVLDMYALPMLFFSLSNGCLIWYLLKRPINKSLQKDARKAGASE